MKLNLFACIPFIPIKAEKSFINPFLIDDIPLMKVLKSLGNFAYMPNSGNLGDMLIAGATMQWFDENHLNWHRMTENETPENFVYGGGGAWIEEWIKDLNPLMIRMQQAKKVVILPSSFYQVPELVAILDERFTVFCREQRSYDYLKSQKTKATILLDHDMAFRLTKMPAKKLKAPTKKLEKLSRELWKKIKTLPPEVKFFRQDNESAGHFKTDLDLSEVFGYFSPYEPRENIDFAMNTLLRVVSSFKKIHTDRLHITIASAMMGVEVMAHDNSYGKIGGVYRQTLHQIPSVYFKEERTEK